MTPQVKQRIEQIRCGEVPEGYKKAKVGVVPSEWEITKLSSISSHVTKKNTDGNIQTTFTNSATQGVIKQTDYFDKEISNRENITGYYVVQENDYIYNPRISASAPCGPINKSHFVDEGVVSPLYTVFKMTNDLQKNQYIEYYLKSPFWHRYMCGVANYGARHDRMNITNDDLFAMPVPLPPLAEQKKIAEILSAQDKLIALKEKLLEEKKCQKKALMQQLLTEKKRLPGFSGEWKKYNFHQIFETVSSRNNQIKSDEYLDNAEYPVVDQGKKKIIAYSNKKEKLLKIPKDGIIVFGDHTREVKYIDFDFIVGADGTQILKSKTNNISTLFLYYALASKKIKSDGYSRHLKYVKELIYRIPEETEQKAIVDIFRSVDKEIEFLEYTLDQEIQKKKALMQLLLTGIVRVEVNE